jgi:hypothetical protein
VSLADGIHYAESRGANTPGIYGDGGQAAGVMQVHPAALADVNARLGTNYTHAQLAADPAIGKLVGDTYVQMKQEEFPGRPDLAAAAYNAGSGAVRASLAAGRGIPNQAYVDTVMGHQGGGVAGLGAAAPAPAPGPDHYAESRDKLMAMLGAPAGAAPAAGEGSAPGAQGLGMLSDIGMAGAMMAGFRSPVNLIPVDYNPFAPVQGRNMSTNGGQATMSLPSLQGRRS